jgi:hypothetical protein
VREEEEEEENKTNLNKALYKALFPPLLSLKTRKTCCHLLPYFGGEVLATLFPLQA